jgi:hypothetical protein
MKNREVEIRDVYVPVSMDPSVRVADGRSEPGRKLILDATRKIDSGTFSPPPRPMMMKALEVWREVGAPDLAIPKRVLASAQFALAVADRSTNLVSTPHPNWLVCSAVHRWRA